MQITRTKKPLSYWYREPKAGETIYCSECRKTKPAGPGSWYCLECSAEHKALDDSFVMPEPFLRAEPSSFTIGHIISSYRLESTKAPEGLRRLGWFVLPPFQRPAVWTPDQKVSFIESVWLELPIGSYAYNDPHEFRHPTEAWLIDGQQRIGAILEYVSGAFPVFGHRYPDLQKVERFRLENRVFPALVTRETDAAVLEEIYDRLAYGGTPHEPKA